MKKLKLTLILLIVFGVVMFSEPLLARISRKSSSGSAPRGFSSGSFSSRALSGRSVSPSRPTQAPRSSFVIPPSMPKSSGSIINRAPSIRSFGGISSRIQQPSQTMKPNLGSSSFSRSQGDNFFRREGNSFFQREKDTLFKRERDSFFQREGDNFFRQGPKIDLRQEKVTPRLPLDNRANLGEGLRKRLDDWRPKKKEPEGQLPPPEERRPAEPRRETRELPREPRREPQREVYEPRDGHWRPYHYYYYPRRRCLIYPIIYPGYYYPVYYEWGPYWSWYYYWPYYHRRYIFVSFGGWWPSYEYIRYYWYPSHLYFWYGYDPTPCRFGGDTYNYYTYNYYTEECNKAKPKEKPVESTQATPADNYFEQGVKAFEKQDYPEAICQLEEAMKLAPEDVVLPFAYLQALFANGQYQKATEVLRDALSKASPEKEGVFYPRGLYLDDNILKEQIDQLSRAVRLNPSDSDLQLLLGYQLLGINRFDEAVEHLTKAQEDSQNKEAATLLLGLLEKLRKTGG